MCAFALSKECRTHTRQCTCVASCAVAFAHRERSLRAVHAVLKRLAAQGGIVRGHWAHLKVGPGGRLHLSGREPRRRELRGDPAGARTCRHMPPHVIPAHHARPPCAGSPSSAVNPKDQQPKSSRLPTQRTRGLSQKTQQSPNTFCGSCQAREMLCMATAICFKCPTPLCWSFVAGKEGRTSC